jgi:hypothetical protein
MNEASTHAQKLALEHGIDLTTLTGTGNEGLITKSDVEIAIGRAAGPQTGFTNIMDAQKAARLAQTAESEQDNVPEAPEVGVEVVVPSQEELMAIIADMRAEITSLQESQAHIIERDNYDRDLTDEMYFLAKPGGHKWEERRIVDKRTVVIEFVGTAFIGPFDDSDQIEVYLKEKRSKREDSYLDWQNVQVMQGKDARALDRQEKHDREAQFRAEESVSTNVLDKRMWSEHGWGAGSQDGIGQVVGQDA